MDKYETSVRIEQIKKLARQREFAAAANVADSIDFYKLKDNKSLSLIADVYEASGNYEQAKEVLIEAYSRTKIGRQLAYRLVRICIKAGSITEAEEFYDEFVTASPRDNSKYILQYELAAAKGAPIEDRIEILQTYLSEDMDDKWAFELAKLYHKSGQKEKCIRQCDEVMLWFNDGKYVEKAMELKMLYAPLTEAQQARYEERWTAKSGVDADDIKIKEYEANNIYNTTNIQDALKESMEVIMNEDDLPNRESEQDIQKAKTKVVFSDEVVNDLLSYTIRDVRIPKSVEGTVPLDPMLDMNQDGQIELSLEEPVDDQIEGQMTIDDILASYETKETKESEEVEPEAVPAMAEGDISSEVPEIEILSEEAVSETEESEAEVSSEEATSETEESEAEASSEEATSESEESEESDAEISLEEADRDFAEVIDDDVEDDMLEDRDDEAATELLDELGEEPDTEQINVDDALLNVTANISEVQAAVIAAMQEEEKKAESDDVEDTIQEIPEVEDEEATSETEEAEATEDTEEQSESSQNRGQEAKSIIVDFIEKYSGVQGLDRQLLAVLQNVVHTDNACVMVMGEVKSGKTALAIDLIKIINKIKGISGKKVAKLSADVLNDENISEYIEKLKGMNIIIERAGLMSRNIQDNILEMIEDSKECVFILEAEKNNAEALLRSNDKLADVFSNIVVVKQKKIRDWVVVAREYAKEQGYEIDEMGSLALHARIDDLYAVSLLINKGQVQSVIDDAIAHSRKRGFGRIFKMFGKESEKILREDDF